MTARWKRARSASSPAASTSSIRRRTKTGSGDVRARPGDRRNAAGHRAARAPLSLPQPDHRRARAGDGGGRGGAALGIADHRAAGGRGGARGDGGAGLAARPAGAGLQPADPRRRDAGPDRRRRDRGDPPIAVELASARRRSFERGAGRTATARCARRSVEELLGPRRCRSTSSSACPARRAARCRWRCSSSSSPAVSTATPAARSACGRLTRRSVTPTLRVCVRTFM